MYRWRAGCRYRRVRCDNLSVCSCHLCLRDGAESNLWWDSLGFLVELGFQLILQLFSCWLCPQLPTWAVQRGSHIVAAGGSASPEWLEEVWWCFCPRWWRLQVLLLSTHFSVFPAATKLCEEAKSFNRSTNTHCTMWGSTAAWERCLIRVSGEGELKKRQVVSCLLSPVRAGLFLFLILGVSYMWENHMIKARVCRSWASIYPAR